MSQKESLSKMIAIPHEDGANEKSKPKHIHGLWVYRKLDLEIIESKKILGKPSATACIRF
jgi:hypothetical protein